MSQLIDSEYFFPSNAFSDRLRELDLGGIRVTYRRSLDGNGSLFAPPIVEFLRHRIASTRPGRPFAKAYEWCAGPAFIGFALLAAGICDELCLADVNPRVVECIERTVRRPQCGGIDLPGSRMEKNA